MKENSVITIPSRRKIFSSEYLKTINYRLSGLADSMRCLSEVIEEGISRKAGLDMTDMNLVFEEISQNVCRNCKRTSICWQTDYTDSYEAACKMMTQCLNDGGINEKTLPRYFTDNCENIKQIIMEANRSLSVARMKLAWHNSLMESRDAVAGQIKEMAAIISGYRNDSNPDDKWYELKQSLIRARMRTVGVRVRQSYILTNESGHTEIHIEARSRKGGCITMKEAAAALGKALNIKLAPREDSRRVITDVYRRAVFCEDTNFKIMCGVSRISGIEGEPSGDNYSFMKTRCGNLIMLLSDGMGMGREAYGESEKVIELMEQLLETGINEETALKLVNSVLVLKSDRLMYSTADLCAINLYSGTCRTIKLGASSTFVKRENDIEIIDSSSLPVGVGSRMEYDISGKKLYSGDYVIMISDGVLESIESENKTEYMKEIISGITVRNPQEMAKEILMSTLAINNYHPKDDMTVLVTGIWEK